MLNLRSGPPYRRREALPKCPSAPWLVQLSSSVGTSLRHAWTAWRPSRLLRPSPAYQTELDRPCAGTAPPDGHTTRSNGRATCSVIWACVLLLCAVRTCTLGEIAVCYVLTLQSNRRYSPTAVGHKDGTKSDIHDGLKLAQKTDIYTETTVMKVLRRRRCEMSADALSQLRHEANESPRAAKPLRGRRLAAVRYPPGRRACSIVTSRRRAEHDMLREVAPEARR